MNSYLKLAWRNIWRNKRRTLITAASIFFAVFFSILMRSFQLGTYSHMIHQSVEMYSGYLQVQHPKFFEEEDINYSLEYTDDLLEKIKAVPGVKSVAPRINNFSFASFGEQSKGIVVMAIDPEVERNGSNPEQNLVHFRLTKEAIAKINEKASLDKEMQRKLEGYEDYSFKNEANIISLFELDKNKKEDVELVQLIMENSKFPGEILLQEDDGVFVSDRLSKYLKIYPGDTLVLMGQGYHGASAAGLFPVRGIVKIISPDLDNKLVYMTFAQAQKYFNMPQMVNFFAVNIDDPDNFELVQQNLQEALPDNQMIVKNWQEINPTLVQQIEGDSKSGLMFLYILYLIIFFGIFGTVLMMFAERKREFGVMVAIGMKKKVLSLIVMIEMLFIGLIGTLAGMLSSAPLIILGYYYPMRITGEMAKMYEDMGFDSLMPMQWFGPYFYMQAVVVVVMVILACYFPLRSVRKMKIINNLHS